MKRIVIVFLTAFSTVGLFNTSAIGQEAENSVDYKRQLQIYQDAKRYNDFAVAKNALYNLKAIAPENYSLLDSLAYFYFDYQQYASSLLVSRDILALNPKHLAALEIQAISFEKLGLLEKALSSYESLYLQQENPYTLYKIGMIQFDLQRHNTSNTSFDLLLKDPAIDEMSVVVTEEGKQQKEIPMRAALLNFQGLNQLELGDKEAARKNFEAAIELAPEYTMAKENLGKI